MKHLFKLKTKNLQLLCVIYEDTRICSEKCIGETSTNVRIKWNKHKYLKKEPQPAILYFPGHLFLMKILLSGPYKNHVKRALNSPEINELKYVV